LRRGGFRKLLDKRARHWIKNEASTRTASDLFHSLDEIFFVRDDDVVGSKRKQFCAFRGCPSGSDGRCALSFGDLDSGQPDAARSRRNDNKIVRLQIAERDQRPIGGHILHPDGGGFYR
jgi:hypothetical protein